MARESVSIIRGHINVDLVLKQLNATLAEEWLSFYQYWIGAIVAKGIVRSDVQREFNQHAMEELQHALIIAERITQLEGTPILNPKLWSNHAACPYEEPDGEFDVIRLLAQNISSERCAITRYQEIARLTDGKDFTTCDIAKKILADELNHEQELQDFIDDINMLYRETFHLAHE